MTGVEDRKLEEACSILFGDQFAIESSTLNYLQISGIKNAYRTRVKECHPDLYGSNPESNENFIRLKGAYDFLISVKSENRPISSVKRKTTQSKTIPMRRLRLGEFLYFSGKISWEDLISAINWQNQNNRRSNKVLFGLYFIKFGILSHSELGFSVFKLKIHNSNFEN